MSARTTFLRVEWDDHDITWGTAADPEPDWGYHLRMGDIDCEFAAVIPAPFVLQDDHQLCDEQLREAIALVEEWAGYASDYFKEKWDLADDLARLRSYLIANTETEGEP